MHTPKSPQIPLPKSWKTHVRSAVLHVISLTRYATIFTRSWAANSLNARVRLKSENDRLSQDVALLLEEIRIKNSRLQRIDPFRRPQYEPVERMAILELRAARGWSMQQTADAFHVTAATISSWMKRLNEQGPDALVQLREPVNRFPDFVRYAVQRLKSLCPSMGKVKIAQVLCRAGLHLGPSTVGRMLKEKPKRPHAEDSQPTGRVVTAKQPNHVWHVDLTAVPINGGFWTAWLPFAFPQCWPFCWWVAIVIDHYSRRVMGFAIFDHNPSSVAIRTFLGRTIARSHAKPKYIICDKGSQFFCGAYKAWCRRRQIKPRFGALGKHGSIAVIERFNRTLKQEGTRRSLVALSRDRFREELKLFVAWFNEQRPHSALAGCTPNEVYRGDIPANRRSRIEPRAGWPRRSRCAAPQTLVAGMPGTRFDLAIHFVEGRRHLPVVTMKRAA